MNDFFTDTKVEASFGVDQEAKTVWVLKSYIKF